METTLASDYPPLVHYEVRATMLGSALFKTRQFQAACQDQEERKASGVKYNPLIVKITQEVLVA